MTNTNKVKITSLQFAVFPFFTIPDTLDHVKPGPLLMTRSSTLRICIKERFKMFEKYENESGVKIHKMKTTALYIGPWKTITETSPYKRYPRFAPNI